MVNAYENMVLFLFFQLHLQNLFAYYIKSVTLKELQNKRFQYFDIYDLGG